MANRPAFTQPKFDPSISTLAMPLSNVKAGLKRGYMVWAGSVPGFSTGCTFHYLYNPSTVEATYSMPDAGVQASLLFPNPGDTSDLRIPINQSASWSVLFDRTYELWNGYNTDATSKSANTGAQNDPSAVGVWADVLQLMEFTGMMANFSAGGTTGAVGTTGDATQNLTSHQGILQMIPAWAYFGNESNLRYYGYISEWDVTFTHWTQYMVPMRCVIDISFTLLPPPSQQTTGSAADSNWVNPFPSTNPGVTPATGAPFAPATSNAGKAGTGR